MKKKEGNRGVDRKVQKGKKNLIFGNFTDNQNRKKSLENQEKLNIFIFEDPATNHLQAQAQTAHAHPALHQVILTAPAAHQVDQQNHPQDRGQEVTLDQSHDALAVHLSSTVVESPGKRTQSTTFN